MLTLRLLFWLTVCRVLVLVERALRREPHNVGPVAVAVMEWDDDGVHTCGNCGRKLQHVRPGKWQFECEWDE